MVFYFHLKIFFCVAWLLWVEWWSFGGVTWRPAILVIFLLGSNWFRLSVFCWQFVFYFSGLLKVSMVYRRREFGFIVEFSASLKAQVVLAISIEFLKCVQLAILVRDL
ncbi:hypothetical protein [Pseudomonas sp. BN515]|uniref:hypothetical protein n=1 Tax=Pseudomonas sp. BN515 TaxID=2567892 RepID=UPI002454457D|nr:hypothetical protein [Pseudomonas sp. BN515]MDH4873809.1 hypothetical protein [Pseudomonas sp. BN515]